MSAARKLNAGVGGQLPTGRGIGNVHLAQNEYSATPTSRKIE
jgi:hypothetical protein